MATRPIALGLAMGVVCIAFVAGAGGADSGRAPKPVLLLHPVKSSDQDAVCNDGSAPYYYAMPGKDIDSWQSKCIIMH